MKKKKLWNKDFVLIIIINFFVFMNHIMILNIFPLFLESLGLAESISGLAAFLFSAIAVVLRPFIGWLLNNGKRKSILLIGLTGMLLMPLGYALSDFIARLCAYDIGLGCGGGIAGVLISAFSYKTMFLTVSVATIISVVIYMIWGRKHPSSLAKKKEVHNA